MQVKQRSISAGVVAIALMAAFGACDNDHGTQELPEPEPAGARIELRLLETTDLHTHIVDHDYYRDAPSITVGLARTASLIHEARGEVANSLLVDNGDLIQGNPLGDYMARSRGLEAGEVHPVHKAMNLLDYEVGNVGNHEFNFGLEFLSARPRRPSTASLR